MALIDLGAPIHYPFQNIWAAAIPSARDKLINASGERAAFICQAPITGSVTKVGFQLDAVASADDLDIRLETVTQALDAWVPSGTLLAAGSNALASAGSLAANTFNEVTLDTPVSVTQGDFLAIVVQFDGDTTVSGSVEVRFRGTENHGFPQGLHRTGGSWVRDSGAHPAMILVYGSDYHNMYEGPYQDSATGSNALLGKDVGQKFTLPFDARLIGVGAGGYGVTTADWSVELYTDELPGSGIQLLAGDFRLVGSTQRRQFVVPPTELKAGVSYRITRRVHTSSDFSSCLVITYGSVEEMAGLWGDDWHFCTEDGAGGWEDYTLKTSNEFHLVLDQIDVGAARGRQLRQLIPI